VALRRKTPTDRDVELDTSEGRGGARDSRHGRGLVGRKGGCSRKLERDELVGGGKRQDACD
jgi:hypothetical protein